MKNKTSFFIFLLALSFSASLLHAFDVVKDGRAKAYILLSENADEVEKFAAEEFAKYVKKMTKADIAISQKEIAGLNAVRFRLTSSADFKKDPARKKLSSLGKFGYILSANKNTLSIFSRSSQGLHPGGGNKFPHIFSKENSCRDGCPAWYGQ